MKVVLGLFLIVAALYLGVSLVPPFWGNYEFQDAVKTEATLQTYTTKPESDIRDAVYKKAQEFDVPITKDQIKVVRTGTQGTGSLSISALYVVHIDLPGYPLDLHFDASSNNKSPF